MLAEKKKQTFTMLRVKALKEEEGTTTSSGFSQQSGNSLSMGFSIPKLIKRQSSGGSCQFALTESLKEETVIEGKSTTFMASFNLLQVTVGVGILGLPRAFLELGGVLGFLFLCICCLLNIWAMKTVIRWKEKTGLKTYEEITEHALGAFGYWFPNITVWLFFLVVLPLLIDVVAAFLFPLLHYIGHSHFANMSHLFCQLFIVGLSIFLYPLLLFKDLSMLSWGSIFGFSCIFILLILTTVVSGMRYQEQISSGLNPIIWNSFPAIKIDVFDGIRCLGSILCSYLSIFSIADIHESLKNKKDMDKVIYIGNLLPLLAYLWMAIAVFIFLHDLELTALNEGSSEFYTSHFKDKSTQTLIICIGSCFEAIAISLRLPLFHFLWRKRTFDMMSTLQSMYSTDFVPYESMPNWFFYGHTLLWFFVTIIGIFYFNVLAYISFIGSFIGGMMMCLFPSLLAMKENGGIKYNLSFSICELDPESESSPNRTYRILYMIFLNLIFYVGICFVSNSFYILITSFMPKENIS